MPEVEKLTFRDRGRRFTTTLQRYLPVAYTPEGALAARDLVVAGVLGAVAVAIIIYTSGRLDPRLYSDPAGFNVWFESDTPRALGAMDNADPRYQARNDVHPIFALLTIPLLGLIKMFGVPALQAALVLIGACGFLTTGLLFLALRGTRLPWMPAALFTAAFLCSATFLHWFAIAETSAFAALSISIVLFVLTRVSTANWWAWTLASAFTLAITVTNWSFALAAAIIRLDLRRAISTSLVALGLVVGLATVQSLAVPGATLFYLPTSVIDEYRYTQIRNNSWSPVANLWSTVVSAAAAPAPYQDLHMGPGQVMQPIVDNQVVSLSSYTLVGIAAIASWIAMLACGILGGIETPRLRAVFAAVCLFLGGQLCLYLVYGNLTFLYATNYFPAVIMLAALGWFSSARLLAIAAAAVFVVTAGWSNLAQFEAAAALAGSILAGS